MAAAATTTAATVRLTPRDIAAVADNNRTNFKSCADIQSPSTAPVRAAHGRLLQVACQPRQEDSTIDGCAIGGLFLKLGTRCSPAEQALGGKRCLNLAQWIT